MARARLTPEATGMKALGRRPDGGLLASRAARREQRAFEQIFERHGGELYRYCFSIVRNREDAEDALQATMAAALRSLPGERRRIALRPWLYRVAHNESVSLVRQRRAAASPEEIVDPVAASAATQLAERDRLRQLVGDLQSLPERQSSALVMRELSGLSYAEIAATLSSSEGAARQAVYEARVALLQIEEGREMECDDARRTLSNHDGRKLRGRRIKAHLSGCDGCHAFAAAIGQRRSDLEALCPPLPALAASSIIAGTLGGSGAGAGTGAAAAGGAGAAAGGASALGAGVAGSAALKGASVLAAVAVAAGAAEVGGVIDLPSPGGGQPEGTPAVEPAGATSRLDGGAAGTTPTDELPGAPGREARSDGDRSEGASGSKGASGGESAQGGGAAGESPGKSAEAPGQTGTSRGKSEAAPGQSGTSPGKSESAPGHSGASPGKSAAAPGNGGSSPGKSQGSSGQSGSTSGKSDAVPGQSEATPGGGSKAGSQSAPGQVGAAAGGKPSATGSGGSPSKRLKGNGSGSLGDSP